jgi:hypothetical protein
MLAKMARAGRNERKTLENSVYFRRNLAEFSQLSIRIAPLEYEAKEKSSGENVNVEGSGARLAAG